SIVFYFFFQAEDGIRDRNVTGVQTCALPIFCLDTHECSSYILPSKFTAFPLYKKIIYFTRISDEIRENASFLHHLSARIQMRTPLPCHQWDSLIHVQSSKQSYSLLSFFYNRQSRTGANVFR